MIARQNPAVKPLIKWYGGKWWLKNKLIDLMPSHSNYIEPFAGGASVLLNKYPCDFEILNDSNELLIHFYTLVRDKPEFVMDALKDVEYSQSHFDKAMSILANSHSLDEKALAFFITSRMSYGGKGGWFAWTDNQKGKSGEPQEYKTWESVKSRVPIVSARLQNVTILSKNAIYNISLWDNEDTLTYCDPPYMHATREKSSRRSYEFEMSDSEHMRLAQVLNRCRGHVIISGFESSEYDTYYAGWQKRSWVVKNNGTLTSKSATGQSATMQEVIWCNFNIRTGKLLYDCKTKS